MRFFSRLTLLTGAVLLCGAQAHAQSSSTPQTSVTIQSSPTDLTEGMTPAQLFNSNCTACHARPQGLVKQRGGLGLSSFLRQHYTSSAQSANALANYLSSLQAAPAAVPAARRQAPSQAGTPGVDRPPANVPRRGRTQDAEPARAEQPGRRGPADRGRVTAEAAKPAESADASANAAETEPKPIPPRDNIPD